MGIWDSVQQISNKSSLPGIILWTKSSVCDELKKKNHVILHKYNRNFRESTLPLEGSGKGSAREPLYCFKLLSSICRDEATNNNAERVFHQIWH